jgi:hypothetical protein
MNRSSTSIVSWLLVSSLLALPACGGSGGAKNEAASPHDGSADSSEATASSDAGDAKPDAATSPDLGATIDAADAPTSIDGAGDAATDARTADAGDASIADTQTDGAPPTAEPFVTAVSGTRLHADRVDATDGTVVTTGLYDTTLGVRCTFGLGSNPTRCLPITSATVAFTDPECKTAVAIAPCTGEAFAVFEGAGTAYYKVGAAIARPAAFWTLQADGAGNTSCTSTDAIDYGDVTTYASATAVPLSAFVEGQERIETRPGWRLGASYWVGADGSKIRSGLEDTQANAAGVSCAVLRTSDGARCFPATAPTRTNATLFADDKCTLGLLEISSGQTPAKLVKMYRQPTAAEGLCGAIYSLYAPGAVHTGAVWRRSGGTCVPGAVSAGNDARALGPDLSSTMLVAVTRELEGGARLGAFAQRGSDGSRFLPQGDLVFDKSFNEICTFTNVAGGGLRCLSRDEYGLGAFGDAACTMPAHDFLDETCSWSGAVASHTVAYTASLACSHREATKAYARGALTTARFEKTDVCTTRPSENKTYLLGAEAPFTDFASGVASRD